MLASVGRWGLSSPGVFNQCTRHFSVLPLIILVCWYRLMWFSMLVARLNTVYGSTWVDTRSYIFTFYSRIPNRCVLFFCTSYEWVTTAGQIDYQVSYSGLDVDSRELSYSTFFITAWYGRSIKPGQTFAMSSIIIDVFWSVRQWLRRCLKLRILQHD